MESRATFETWTSRSIKTIMFIFRGWKKANILNILGYLTEMTLEPVCRYFFHYFWGLLEATERGAGVVWAFFRRKRHRSTSSVVAGIPRVHNVDNYCLHTSSQDWSQTPHFHLLNETFRLTLTSQWIILRFPGENFFLEQSLSCILEIVLLRVRSWEG